MIQFIQSKKHVTASTQNMIQELMRNHTLLSQTFCWNVNGTNQNKVELPVSLDNSGIDVLLISETHLTDKSNFMIHVFKFNNTKHPDVKVHAVLVNLMKNYIKHYVLDGS